MKRNILLLTFLLIYVVSYSQIFDFEADQTQGCSPLKVIFSNTSQEIDFAEYSFEWTVENGKFSAQTTDIQNTYISAGFYSVSMKVFDKDKNLVTTIEKPDYIHVFRDPDVEITSDRTSACEDQPFTFSITKIEAESPIVAYSWILSDGTGYFTEVPPSHMFGFADDFEIFLSVEDQNGCLNRDRKSIFVKTYNDFPEISFTTDKSRACESSLPVNFTNTTETPNLENFLWDFGDGETFSGKNPPKHTYNGFGNYTAKLSATSKNGCTSSNYKTIRLIDFQPEIGIIDAFPASRLDKFAYEDNQTMPLIPQMIDEKAKFCAGTITFFDNSPEGNANLTWKWDLNNDGKIESNKRNFQLTITEHGTYTMALTVSNGSCEKKITRTFEIEEPLNVTATPTNDFYCSTPVNVAHKATSNIEGTQFLWHFDGDEFSDEANISREFWQPGTYSATLFALSPNSCPAIVDLPQNVEVAVPQISPQYRYYSKLFSGCVPLTVPFGVKFDYQTERDSIKSISWDFQNDGIAEFTDNFSTRQESGITSHDFTYSEVGVYDYSIKITTAKGCSVVQFPTSDETKIKVGDVPNVTVEIPDAPICASENIIGNVIYGDDSKRYQTQWDTLQFIFTSLESPDYEHLNLKIGIQPAPELFTGDTIGWFSYNYTVSDNGCKTKFVGTNPDKVLVNGPLIKMQSQLSSCATPLIYTYSLLIDYGKTSIEWVVRDLNNGNDYVVANDVNSVVINFADFSGRGDYVIKAIAQNATTNCTYVDSISTHVVDLQADFELKNYTPCLGDEAKFIVSPETGQDVVQWKWIHNTDTVLFATNFRNELGIPDFRPIAPLKKYTFDTVGIQNVKVLAIDEKGCQQSSTKPVKVYQPTADFSGDILDDCLPFTTNFTDKTVSDTLIVKRDWSFGNTETADGNLANISTEYTTPEPKTVSLTVTDVIGCTNTKTRSNYVVPTIPNAQFTLDHNKICLGHETVLNYDNSLNIKNITKYAIDFGNGEKIEKNGNPPAKITYDYPAEAPQQFYITFTAYSKSPQNHECVSEYVDSVEVKDLRSNIVIQSSDKCKEPDQKFIVYLKNVKYSSGLNSFAWWKIDGGDSVFISNNRSLKVVTFNNYGEQSLFLQTRSNYFGCEHAISEKKIQVHGYEADFEIDKSEVCVNEDITFTLKNANNLQQYNSYWEFGDGESVVCSTEPTSHAYSVLPTNNSNSYKAQLIVEAEGCKPRDISAEITLHPVQANFIRGENDADTAACAPFSVQLHNTSVSGERASYMWYLPNGEISTDENPKITLSQADSLVPISLVLTSSICSDSVSKQIRSLPVANVMVDMDSVICFGETIHAKASGDYTSFQWSPKQLFSSPTIPQSDISVPKSQYIYINTKNAFGCKHTDSVFVYVQQKPYYVGAPVSPLFYLNPNDSLVQIHNKSNELIVGQIYSFGNTAIEGVNYTWTPETYLSCNDCPNPFIDLTCGGGVNCLEFPETLSYHIAMEDSLGCFTNDTTILFTTIIDTKLALPEAFTPNGDGNNDIALVRGWGYKEFIELKIYNRWGQVVFQTNDITQGWDGTFGGKPQGMDTFAYTIKATDMRGDEVHVQGYITLVR